MPFWWVDGVGDGLETTLPMLEMELGWNEDNGYSVGTKMEHIKMLEKMEIC